MGNFDPETSLRMTAPCKKMFTQRRAKGIVMAKELVRTEKFNPAGVLK
jgi:hypothetical protein